MAPIKISRLVKHLLFWAVTFAFYSAYFGFRGDIYGQSSLFVGLLLPITVCTSYWINYRLIPDYLFRGRTLTFALYLFYTIVFSLYLELCLMMLLYLNSGDIQSIFSRPSLFDLVDLVIGMYIVVFGAVSLNLWGRWNSAHSQSIEQLGKRRAAESKLEQIQSVEPQFLSLRSERKELRIPAEKILYVESIKDYVLVHTGKEQIMSKRTLSSVESELAEAGFLRIHRSYLVRPEAIEAYSASEVQIGNTALPISRTYRETAREALQGK